jgi:predicted deacylase
MSNFLPKGSPMAYMKEIGKVGITVELGGRSATGPGALAHVGRELANSILNILRHYKMYPGAAAYPNPRYIGVQEALLAPASGIFLPAPGVEFLTMMKKGDPLATIVSIFGDKLAELVAPADGMFFGLRALPNVQTGDWCCFFCKVSGTRD